MSPALPPASMLVPSVRERVDPPRVGESQTGHQLSGYRGQPLLLHMSTDYIDVYNMHFYSFLVPFYIQFNTTHAHTHYYDNK